jgi:hypothetical protein
MNTEPKFSSGRATRCRSTQISHMRMFILAEVSENRTSLRTSSLPKLHRWSRLLRERKGGLMLGVFDDASSNV